MSKPRTLRPDLATFLGLFLATAGVLGGLLLEGGALSDISQVTAAVIVLGGTFGAVLVTTPTPVLLRALGQLKFVFFQDTRLEHAILDEILVYAHKARKHGLVSLEREVEQISDPFLKKALILAVDGADLRDLRQMMEFELQLEERRMEAAAKVYDAAGGYAPTIGIIGAVMGLIQVMKHLENIDEVGRGIAVAFVATVYGVSLANLLFLPAGSKLRARIQKTTALREMMLEGVVSIVEGMNPKLIQIKLEAFLDERKEPAPSPKPASQKLGQGATVQS